MMSNRLSDLRDNHKESRERGRNVEEGEERPHATSVPRRMGDPSRTPGRSALVGIDGSPTA